MVKIKKQLVIKENYCNTSRRWLEASLNLKNAQRNVDACVAKQKV